MGMVEKDGSDLRKLTTRVNRLISRLDVYYPVKSLNLEYDPNSSRLKFVYDGSTREVYKHD